MDKLEQAISHHQKGETVRAKELYNAVIDSNEISSVAHHNLGQILGTQGDINQALSHLKKALELEPRIEQYWVSYVELLKNQGYDTVANQVITHAKISGYAGSKIYEMEPEESKKKIRPSNQMSSIQDKARLKKLLHKKRHVEAENLATTMLKNHPDDVDILFTLSDFYQEQEETGKALEVNFRIHRLRPDSFEILYNIGKGCENQGRYNEAELYYRKGLEINPQHLATYLSLSNLLKKSLKLKEAALTLTTAISRDVCDTTLYLALGLVYLDLDSHTERAAECFQNAIEACPSSVEAHHYYGLAMINQNRRVEAKYWLEKTLELDPLYSLSILAIEPLIGKEELSSFISEIIKSFEIHKVNKNLLDISRICFALGRSYDRLKLYDLAFPYFIEANRIRKEKSNYNIISDRERFDRIRKSNNGLLQLEVSVNQAPLRARPIFIVGMPRSGTTLVEQILSSHSEIFGGGELQSALNYGLPLADRNTPITKQEIIGFRKSYLEDISQFPNEKHYIVDKMPHNFLVLGLIKKAIPESKIVLVTRESKSICWSNFVQPFDSEMLEYSNDLHDIVGYYSLFRGMIDDLITMIGNDLITLNYEQLAADPKTAITSLFQSLNINVEEDCFRPEKNTRAVATASNSQVRKEIYQGSNAAWQNYSKFLEGYFLGFDF